MRFDRSKMREGMNLHGRGQTLYAHQIRRVLGIRLPPGKKCWGNHDAIIVRDIVTKELMIGESVPVFAKMTPLADYERMINAGKYEVRIYRVAGASEDQCQAAADYWIEHINNTVYDFCGIAKLLLKSLFATVSNKGLGWEWAHWCTEGVADAWKQGAMFDVWCKTNPTPYTTEKRVEDGVLEDVTSQVVIPETACCQPYPIM